MPLIQYISRVRFDFGAISTLGEEREKLSIARPLLITDAGVCNAGHLRRALDAIGTPEVQVYDGTTENPNEASLLECLDIWRDKNCDGIVALGGGSSIDLAKAVALLTQDADNLLIERSQQNKLGQTVNNMVSFHAIKLQVFRTW